MHLKLAVLVIVLVCSAGLGEERRRKKRSSSSDDSTPQSSSSSESSWSLETLSSSDLSPLSQSSSSHNSPKGKKRPRSCLKRQFRRRRGCEKCCCNYGDCYACQQNYHNNKYKCALVYCDSVWAPDNGEVTAISNHECGSYLQYTCHDGYQRVGPEWRTCQSGGNWDKYAPVCKAICPSLCPPSNGYKDMTQGNLAGDTVYYGCDHDFYLVGAEERTCLYNGTWDLDDPHCEPVVKCPIPCDIVYGEIGYSGLYENDNATYLCDYDYYLIGPAVRYCINGNWTKDEPKCVPVVKCQFPCDPSNGGVSFDMSNVRVGDMAWYTCDYDFILNGPEERTCEGNGTWSGPEPTCTPVVKCQFPCAPSNGEVSFDMSNVRVGDMAVYNCDYDFILNGPEERTCESNGTWSGPEPTCTPVVKCQFPCDPSNGEVTFDMSNVRVGDMAWYNCDYDFILNGPEERTCEGNGTWSGPEPTCTPVVKCPFPCDPSNGGVSFDMSNVRVGDMAWYSCDYDFILNGPEKRTCEGNGTWSGPEPTCTPVVKCPFPCDPSNGGVSFDMSNVRVGDMAWYSCDYDFILNGPEKRTCEGNGTWSGPEPTCTPVVKCPFPCDPSNGGVSFDMSNVRVGDMAWYTCDYDFILNGQEKRTCEGNGTWSGPEPTCTPVVRCPDLCNPQNGHAFYNDTIVGTEAEFQCFPDFILSDNYKRVCESNGNWNSPSPDCTPVVRCPDLCNPDYGEVNFNKTTVGSVAMYTCKEGFNLDGQLTRECQVDGTWSPSEPNCTPIVRCPNLCNPNNGEVGFLDTIVDSVAMYTCEEGFNLDGAVTRECQADGTWSPSEPNCTPIVRCPWLSPPTDSRLQVYGQYKVGSTAVYECNFGFTLFGEDRRECNESGTWVPKLPPTCHPVRNCENKWYKVYENDDNGVGLTGGFKTLVNALNKGAEVRVRFPTNGVVAPLQNVIAGYVSVCGQIIFSMLKDDYDRFQSSAIWHFKYVCTASNFDNLYYNYGEYVSPGHDHIRIRTQWFIRERCHSKPLLSVSEDDYGNSGSVLSVIDAMKLGHGIHVTINGFIQYLSSDNIEYSELEDEVVAMDIWQIVTGYATTHVRFTSYPLWWFSLYSSSRMVKGSLWQIGDHEYVGPRSYQPNSMSWYANDCWDHVYDNDENGMAQNGLDINDLRAKASNGHKIKLMYNRTLTNCDEVILKDDHVCCTCFNKLSKSGLDEFTSDVYHIPEIVCTNGWINRLLIKIGSNEMGEGITEERASISWFADVRSWKKVASISNSGVVISGSKEILTNAVVNGADVRYMAEFGTAYFRIVSPDHIEIDEGNLGAMHIRSISIQPDNILVLKFKPTNPYLWATIMADTGRMDKFRWILGEHTPLTHNSGYHPTEWFVNY